MDAETEEKSSPLITVCICTHKRAEILREAIESIFRQRMDPSSFELIVVDNNSKDDTPLIVREFIIKCPNLRYVFEPLQGLSNARNRGWMEARGEYIGYMDDDCRASEDWLLIARGVIERFKPHVFGGPYIATFRGDKPIWFRYGDHIPYDISRQLERHEYGALTGGNIFFLRSILQKYNGFEGHLGMRPKGYRRGEETELLRRVALMEKEPLLYYERSLVVFHLVDRERMRPFRIILNSFSSGRSSYLIHRMDPARRPYPIRALADMLSHVIRFLAILLLGVVKREKRLYPFYMNYIYERALPALQEAGKSYEEIVQKLKGKGDRWGTN